MRVPLSRVMNRLSCCTAMKLSSENISETINQLWTPNFNQRAVVLIEHTMNITSAADLQYKFDNAEYVVFGVMLGISTLIGIYFGFIKGGQNTVSGYLFGGKQMTIFPISMSLISSFISGITLLGAPTETYIYGGQYIMGFLAMILVGLVMIFVFLPVFYKLQLCSVYEYLELRFCSRVRRVVAILFIISLLAYIPVVIYGPAVAMNQVSGVNVHLITPVICVVCIFYTTVGGLKAVVWSDAIQGAIMIISVIIVAILGTINVGGVSEVIDSASKGGRLNMLIMDPDPTLRLSFWSVTIGLCIHWCGNCAVNPANVQRFISLQTQGQAAMSIVYFCIGSKAFSCLCGIMGLIIYAAYKGCDPYLIKAIEKPDQIMPYFTLDVAGHVKGLPGLFLAGVVCAALSTMSTGLNTVSGIIYKDLLEPCIPFKLNDERISQIMKLIVIVFGSICVLLVLVIERLGTILELATAFGGITNGAKLGIFILGILFPMSNAMGAMIGGIVGLCIPAWMMIGSKLAFAQGLMKHPSLPLSVENCPFNVTNFVRTIPDIPLTADADVFPLYKISLFYYSLIGCSTVIIVGLIVSYATGPNKVQDVNRDLLCPLIHRFLPEKPDQEYNTIPQKDIFPNYAL